MTTTQFCLVMLGTALLAFGCLVIALNVWMDWD